LGCVICLVLSFAITGYAGAFWTLDRGGVMRISPIQFIVPIAGVVFGCLLFNEAFTLVMFFRPSPSSMAFPSLAKFDTNRGLIQLSN
jgi:hypothetical protein